MLDAMCLEQDIAASISSPDQRAAKEEQVVLFSKAIDSLPDDQRQAVTLYQLKPESLPIGFTALYTRNLQLIFRLQRKNSGQPHFWLSGGILILRAEG